MRRLAGALLATLIVPPALAQTGNLSGASVSASGTTTPRTLANRAADVANILDHGGNSGGSVDNSAALNAALAKAKRVYFPAGTYGFSTKATIPAGVSEIYCDQGATFKALPGNASNSLFFSAGATVTGLTVKGCKFDGNASAVGVNTLFVQVFQAANVVFEDCYFTNNRWHMLSFTSSTNSGVRNSRFMDVGNYNKGTSSYALAVTVTYNTSGSGNFFNRNFMYNLGGDAIDAGSQTDFQVNDNFIIGDNTGWVNLSSGAGTGLYVFENSTRGTISGNYIYGLTGNGIDVDCISDFSISGNTSLNNGGAGIAISGHNSPACSPTRLSVTGNVVNNNYQAVSGRVSLTTNGSTAAGNAVLNFASTTGVVAGMYVYDASGGVPVGTKVLSTTSTTVTIDANATGSGVASSAAIQFLNRFSRPPAPDAGIWLGCVGGACTSSLISFAGNTATDSQATKTQSYGIHYASDMTATNVKVSADNVLAGNLTADILNATTQGAGTGSNSTVLWNSSGATASGNFGSIAGGFSSAASGTGAIALGTSNTASGTYGVTLGNGARDWAKIGRNCYASGQLSGSGDAQTCYGVMRGTGASTSAVRLTTNNSTAATTNCFNIDNNTAWSVVLNITALSRTSVGKNMSWLKWGGLLTRGANAASTAVTMESKPTPITNGTVTGADIAVTADTTNGCLNVSFTPPTSNTDTWVAVARIESTEVQ